MEALEAASRVIVEGLSRHSSAAMEVTTKGYHGDVVCALDVAADEALCAVIEKRRPGDVVLSEELRPDTATGSGRVWICDPLDATSALSLGLGDCYPAVLIALLDDAPATPAGAGDVGAAHAAADGAVAEGRRVRLAVAGFPLTQEVFYAALGRGSFWNGTQLGQTHCSSAPQKALPGVHEPPGALLSALCVDMNQHADAQYESAAFATLRTRLRSPQGGARLVTALPPHSGVGLRILRPAPPCGEGVAQHGLAAAVHDGHPERPKQMPWDIAAPQLIVEEAGGAVVYLDTLERVDCTVPATRPFLVARTPAIALAIHALMSPVPEVATSG